MTQNKEINSINPGTHDIVTLLKADHEKVRALFDEFEALKEEKTFDIRKGDLVKKICEELMLHTLAEDFIVYPAARGIIDRDLMDEADVEHAGARELISQLQSMDPNESHFNAKVTVLRKNIEHHIKEEESEILPRLLNTKIDIRVMAEEVIQFKKDRKDTQLQKISKKNEKT